MLVARLDVIGGLERVPDIGSVEFAAQCIGHALDVRAEIGLHLLGQLETLILFEHPGEAALAGLRIDPDHRFVAAAEVGGVDRQIGDAPVRVILRFERAETLPDRVLVATRKGRVDQFAAIGMALVNGQLVAIFDRLDHAVDIGEIEPRVDALRVHVERHRHEAAIARALAIAEQAAFDTVGPGHQRQFGRRDARAAVVMRMQADHRAVAVGQIADEIFDLVGVDVGRRRLDRGGQVEDDRVVWRRGQHLHHRLADLEAEIEFCGGEGFRAVLEMPVGTGLLARFVAHDLGAVNRDVADLVLGHPEDHFAPRRADCVVEVDDRLLRAGQAGETGADQILAALGEYLDEYIVGNAVRLHEAGDEIEFGRARAGETDLDLAHPDFDQQVEEPVLLMRVHRIDDRLVAVAQIGAEPARRRSDGTRRPLAVGEGNLRKGRIFAARITEHGHGMYSAVA